MRRSHSVTPGSSRWPGSPIILGCFDGTPHALAVAEACRGLGDVVSLADRALVTHRALHGVAALVILPLADADGIPTAPLIGRLHEGNVPVAICLSGTAPRVGLAQALRSGAQLLDWNTADELEEQIGGLVQHGGMSRAEEDALATTLAFVVPVELRALLTRCTLLAHRRLTVAHLAASLSMSARTLHRETTRLDGPPPAEIITWGRVLRVSLARWSGSGNRTALVRSGGFSSSAALLAAIRDRLAVCQELDELTPLRVGRALALRLRFGTR